jgi:hypothetical protein
LSSDNSPSTTPVLMSPLLIPPSINPHSSTQAVTATIYNLCHTHVFLSVNKSFDDLLPVVCSICVYPTLYSVLFTCVCVHSYN